MDFHFAFQLVGASADLLAAVICFPPCKDSSDSLATEHPQDVGTLSSRANFEPVSARLQGGIRFFLPLTPAYPHQCALRLLRLGFTCLNIRREYRISTFHAFAN
jgi:hypothetical protein